MDSDGKTIPSSETGIGVIYKGVTFYLEDFRKGAVYGSVAAADAAAKSFGWSCIDGDHRCPECAAKEKDRSKKTTRHGMYVPVDFLEKQ